MKRIVWEEIEAVTCEGEQAGRMYRTRAGDGWLVHDLTTQTVTFVPDPEGEWELGEVPQE